MRTEDEIIDEVCKLIAQLDDLRIWKARQIAVRPNDVLVIHLQEYHSVPARTRERYAQALSEKLGIKKILITDASVEVYAARNSSNVSTETE